MSSTLSAPEIVQLVEDIRLIDEKLLSLSLPQDRQPLENNASDIKLTIREALLKDCGNHFENPPQIFTPEEWTNVLASAKIDVLLARSFYMPPQHHAFKEVILNHPLAFDWLSQSWSGDLDTKWMWFEALCEKQPPSAKMGKACFTHMMGALSYPEHQPIKGCSHLDVVKMMQSMGVEVDWRGINLSSLVSLVANEQKMTQSGAVNVAFLHGFVDYLGKLREMDPTCWSHYGYFATDLTQSPTPNSSECKEQESASMEENKTDFEPSERVRNILNRYESLVYSNGYIYGVLKTLAEEQLVSYDALVSLFNRLPYHVGPRVQRLGDVFTESMVHLEKKIMNDHLGPSQAPVRKI